MAERKRKRPQKARTAVRVTAGTTIRMEKASSARKPKPNVVIVTAQEINPVTGFMKFIRDYGVIGVAVGFAIASQSQLLIKSLLDNFINPLYPLIFNSGKLENKTSVLNIGDRSSGEIRWGVLFTQIVNFVFVLAIIYLIIKVLALDKLDKDKEEENDAKK